MIPRKIADEDDKKGSQIKEPEKEIMMSSTTAMKKDIEEYMDCEERNNLEKDERSTIMKKGDLKENRVAEQGNDAIDCSDEANKEIQIEG